MQKYEEINFEIENVEKSFEKEFNKIKCGGKESNELLKIYLEDISKYKVLDEFELEEINERLMQGDELAKQELINSNLKLVVSIAKKYINRGVELLDLIQEGNIGLIKSANKYDPTKGLKFTTYATYWIIQSITREIINQGNMIRVPIYTVQKINKLNNFEEELTQKLSKVPNYEELAEHSNLPIEKVYKLKSSTNKIVSIDHLIGEEKKTPLGDFITEQTNSSFKYSIDNQLLKEELDKLFECLTPFEKNIIELRFGLNGNDPYTLEEVGKMYGITKERVRQIEVKTIVKLKNCGNLNRIKEFK